MNIGSGKMVTVELEDNRIFTLDLDCQDDWVDLRVTQNSEDKSIKVELGNDCEGWFKIVRCWEKIDKDGADVDFIDMKYGTYIEVDIDDLVEWILIREIAYRKNMTTIEHKKMMEEYGFVYENLYIPNEWKNN